MNLEDSNERKRWELEHWFHRLIENSLKQNGNSIELRFIEMSLRYLHVEAKANRSRRDHKGIRRTWLLVHPYLKKYRMLEEYADDVPLKNSLLFFVRNGFI